MAIRGGQRSKFRQRQLVVEAGVLLIAAKLALLVVPFKRLAPSLGKSVAVTTPSIGHDDEETAQAVAWAVESAARRLPWHSSCFARAIVGKRMLDLRRIPAMLYLGVRKDESGKLHAHAWLESRGVCVTGALAQEAYSPIARFASAPVVADECET